MVNKQSISYFVWLMGNLCWQSNIDYGHSSAYAYHYARQLVEFLSNSRMLMARKRAWWKGFLFNWTRSRVVAWSAHDRFFRRQVYSLILRRPDKKGVPVYERALSLPITQSLTQTLTSFLKNLCLRLGVYLLRRSPVYLIRLDQFISSIFYLNAEYINYPRGRCEGVFENSLASRNDERTKLSLESA